MIRVGYHNDLWSRKMNRFIRVGLTVLTSVLALPFMALLVLMEVFVPLRAVFSPNHWCIYGNPNFCFLGHYAWVSNLLGNFLFGIVCAAYLWLQWRLIWKS